LKIQFVVLFAIVMLVAHGAVHAAHAAVIRSPLVFASADDGDDGDGGDDYMDDNGDSVGDDDVPVFNLPPDDDGTESDAAVVTPGQSEYSKTHPAQELEDDADE